ncbi:hypothetical protein HK097_004954, partial [Rhizophlyctis rosea]
MLRPRPIICKFLAFFLILTFTASATATTLDTPTTKYALRLNATSFHVFTCYTIGQCEQCEDTELISSSHPYCLETGNKEPIKCSLPQLVNVDATEPAGKATKGADSPPPLHTIPFTAKEGDPKKGPSWQSCEAVPVEEGFRFFVFE